MEYDEPTARADRVSLDSGQEVGVSADIESLGLLEEITATELLHRQAHAEALDTKAGIVLGLAGAIVALWTGSTAAASPEVRITGILAIINGVIAALMALLSFWPREFEVLEVRRIRAEVLGRTAFKPLRVAILDTRIGIVSTYSAVIESKARRLKASMAFLVSAVVLLGVDFLLENARR